MSIKNAILLLIIMACIFFVGLFLLVNLNSQSNSKLGEYNVNIKKEIPVLNQEDEDLILMEEMEEIDEMLKLHEEDGTGMDFQADAKVAEQENNKVDNVSEIKDDESINSSSEKEETYFTETVTNIEGSKELDLSSDKEDELRKIAAEEEELKRIEEELILTEEMEEMERMMELQLIEDAEALE